MLESGRAWGRHARVVSGVGASWVGRRWWGAHSSGRLVCCPCACSCPTALLPKRPFPPAPQAEWAFALREADESFKRTAVVPRLALAAAGGRRAVARDVTVFRVDSLEDTPVGQAVLIRDWSLE